MTIIEQYELIVYFHLYMPFVISVQLSGNESITRQFECKTSRALKGCIMKSSMQYFFACPGFTAL